VTGQGNHGARLSFTFPEAGEAMKKWKLKKIGEKAAKNFAGNHDFENIDEFVESMGKNKTVMERLIFQNGISMVLEICKWTRPI
jgi:hypothetical protein